MGKTVRGSSAGTLMGKSAEMGMLVCSSKQGFSSEYVDDIKMAGKKQNMALMWILTNPHHLLTMFLMR